MTCALLTATLLDKACYYHVHNKCWEKKKNPTSPQDCDWQRPITTTPKLHPPSPPSTGFPLALCQVDAWNEFGKSSICRAGVEILAWILKTFQTGGNLSHNCTLSSPLQVWGCTWKRIKGEKKCLVLWNLPPPSSWHPIHSRINSIKHQDAHVRALTHTHKQSEMQKHCKRWEQNWNCRDSKDAGLSEENHAHIHLHSLQLIGPGAGIGGYC